MANRLADSTSPYLLQHKDNPVDWWEWSPEAFAEAERRGVPVLLSIGYAACHWCHVTLRASHRRQVVRSRLSRLQPGYIVPRAAAADQALVCLTGMSDTTERGGHDYACWSTSVHA
jgi:hypothetical protein